MITHVYQSFWGWFLLRCGPDVWVIVSLACMGQQRGMRFAANCILYTEGRWSLLLYIWPFRLARVKHVLAVAALLMCSCSSGDNTPKTEPDVVQPSVLDYPVGNAGPFNVGYRSVDLSYSAKGSGGERSTVLHIWYPTHAESGSHPSYVGVFLDDQVITDAPPAAPVGLSYPLHLYSHGHMGFGPSSAFLMRYFASHGWISVAPDHTGNTIADNITPRPLAIYHLRAQDISAAIDAIATDTYFSTQVNAERVLLSGHSFGVHTCWAGVGATFDMEAVAGICRDAECPQADLDVLQGGVGDSRIMAAIPMAGSIDRNIFGDSGHSSVKVPLFSMSGSNDPVGANTQFETAAGVDLRWIDIEGGCHQSFGLGSCDTLTAEQGFAVINTYALAFGRAQILNDSADNTLGILDGSVEVSPLVSFKRRMP